MNVEFVPEDNCDNVLFSVHLICPPATGDFVTLSVKGEDREFTVVRRHWVLCPDKGAAAIMAAICTVKPCTMREA